jgi:aminocarboxymuconate-semialdehyde decarboxylase
MQDPILACEEMTRCIQDLGMKGVQIGTHINEWNLDEPKLYPIWKKAEDLRCPIFVFLIYNLLDTQVVFDLSLMQ